MRPIALLSALLLCVIGLISAGDDKDKARLPVLLDLESAFSQNVKFPDGSNSSDGLRIVAFLQDPESGRVLGDSAQKL